MSKRDIGQEILDGIQAIKRGEGKTYQVSTDVDAKQGTSRLHLHGTGKVFPQPLQINGQ